MNSTNQTNNSTWTLNDIISFHYLPYTVLNIIGMLVGVFGNLLILSAILLTKQLQNTANILIFNLSFAQKKYTTFMFIILNLIREYFQEINAFYIA